LVISAVGYPRRETKYIFISTSRVIPRHDETWSRDLPHANSSMLSLLLAGRPASSSRAYSAPKEKTVLALFGPRAASPRREITKDARTQRPTGREAAAWHGWYVQGDEITYGSRVTSCRIQGGKWDKCVLPRQGACKKDSCVISHRPSWVPGNMEQTQLGFLEAGESSRRPHLVSVPYSSTIHRVRYAPTDRYRSTNVGRYLRSHCVFLRRDCFDCFVGCIPMFLAWK